MSELPTRPGWTPEITAAVHGFRAQFSKFDFLNLMGSAPSVAERATLPTEGIPDGIHLSSVIIPPASNIPALVLDGRIEPSEVPAFFYATKSLQSFNPVETRIVMHIHGGANIVGHPADPRNLIALGNLAKRIEGVVFAPSYRLTTVPENTFPANLQDVFSAYQYLLDKGYQPKNITLSGESSGGNAAFTLVYLLSQARLPLPSRLIAFSPAADVTYEHMSDHAKAQEEVDLFTMKSYIDIRLHHLYQDGCTFPKNTPLAQSKWKADDPLVSAAFIPSESVSGAKWPKTLIMVGTADMLVDASYKLAETLKKGGADVKLVVYEHVTHGFWGVGFFPEGEKSWEEYVKFVKS